MESFDEYIKRSQEQHEKMLAYKLMRLKSKAREVKEHDLYYLLKNMNLTATSGEEIVETLHRNGYMIEVDWNSPKVEERGEGVYAATISTDDIKMKVRKTIIEI